MTIQVATKIAVLSSWQGSACSKHHHSSWHNTHTHKRTKSERNHAGLGVTATHHDLGKTCTLKHVQLQKLFPPHIPRRRFHFLLFSLSLRAWVRGRRGGHTSSSSCSSSSSMTMGAVLGLAFTGGGPLVVVGWGVLLGAVVVVVVAVVGAGSVAGLGLGRAAVEGAGVVGEATVGPRRAHPTQEARQYWRMRSCYTSQMQVHAQHFYIDGHKP